MCETGTLDLVLTVTLVPSLTLAQQPCANGMRVEGTITNPTGSVIVERRIPHRGALDFESSLGPWFFSKFDRVFQARYNNSANEEPRKSSSSKEVWEGQPLRRPICSGAGSDRRKSARFLGQIYDLPGAAEPLPFTPGLRQSSSDDFVQPRATTLQYHVRHEDIGQRSRSNAHPQPVLEPDLLDREVQPQEFEFASERDFLGLHVIEREAEEIP
jgi:hypothetical protein